MNAAIEFLKPETVANIEARVSARDYRNVPVRMQIVVGDVLQVDVVLSNPWEAEMLYSAYAKLKVARGKAWGGSAVGRADLSPAWHVKVGAHIRACCELCYDETSDDRRDTQPIESCEGAYDRLVMCANCRTRDVCPSCMEPLTHPSPNYAACAKVIERERDTRY